MLKRSASLVALVLRPDDVVKKLQQACRLLAWVCENRFGQVAQVFGRDCCGFQHSMESVTIMTRHKFMISETSHLTKTEHTVRYSQESNYGDGIAMSTAYIVAHVPN